MSTKLFNAGIPTEPDVNRLREKFGCPEIGAVIEYAEIEKIIGEERGSSRFQSVVSAWRKKLDREHNVIMDAVPNVGLKALDNHQRIDFSGRRYRSHLRGVSRAANVADRTAVDDLTQDELRVRDHLSRAGAAIRLAAATEAKRLKYDFVQKKNGQVLA